MKDAITVQDKTVPVDLGTLLRTSKLVILLEVTLVLLPLYLALAISDRI